MRGLLQEGRVRLNARPLRVASRPVHAGDVFDVILDPDQISALPPGPTRPLILFLDSWLVAAAKPSGVASQPPRRRRAGEMTFQEIMTCELSLREGLRTEAILVHRLDRPTTGAMVFARRHAAARFVTRAWQEGLIEKSYLTVVLGDPGNEPLTIEESIARDPSAPGRFRVARNGKTARTDAKRLATDGAISLLLVTLATGRTHQVRVHLAHVGHPIVGDSRYGGSGAPRPLLHAWRLAMPHPSGSGHLSIEAPIPEDLRDILLRHDLAVGPI